MPALPFSRYGSVSLAHIRPAGWLDTFLQRQCAGITGHPEASGYPFTRSFWSDPHGKPDVPDQAMLWWPYEQTAYWIDGSLKAGYLTGNEAVYKRALHEIDAALAQAADDGFIGPDMFRTRDRWPSTIFFRAVLAQHAISGDQSYVDALVRHYQSTPHPMGFGRDVTGVEILLALFAETGRQELLDEARDLYQRFTSNARNLERDFSLAGLQSDRPVATHGVTFNEIAKLPALLYAASGERELLDATLNGYAKVERDNILADGLHSGAEAMSGNAPLESHETCTITDYTWSLGHLLQITGNPHFGDQIERVIFNALPGVLMKDWKALQYFSCANQVVATNTSNHNPMSRGDNRMEYRPGHPVQCCTGNVQRALPNYVERMWMRGSGDHAEEIVAALYGPGRLDTQIAGTRVVVEASTSYPFEQGVAFRITPDEPARFTFTVRIPEWCRTPGIRINGEEYSGALTPGSFHQIERMWNAGDDVVLRLPFELAIRRWSEGGVSLEYGPLTLSLPIDAPLDVDTEDDWTRTPKEFRLSGPQPRLPGFPAYQLRPASRWAFALAVDETTLAQTARITWSEGDGFPLDSGNPAVRVSVPVRRVEGWNVVETDHVQRLLPSFENGVFRMVESRAEGDFLLTPPLPDASGLAARLSDEVEWIDLVPFGNTLLRLTVFPDGMTTQQE